MVFLYMAPRERRVAAGARCNACKPRAGPQATGSRSTPIIERTLRRQARRLSASSDRAASKRCTMDSRTWDNFRTPCVRPMNENTAMSKSTIASLCVSASMVSCNQPQRLARPLDGLDRIRRKPPLVDGASLPLWVKGSFSDEVQEVIIDGVNVVVCGIHPRPQSAERMHIGQSPRLDAGLKHSKGGRQTGGPHLKGER